MCRAVQVEVDRDLVRAVAATGKLAWPASMAKPPRAALSQESAGAGAASGQVPRGGPGADGAAALGPHLPHSSRHVWLHSGRLVRCRSAAGSRGRLFGGSGGSHQRGCGGERDQRSSGSSSGSPVPRGAAHAVGCCHIACECFMNDCPAAAAAGGDQGLAQPACGLFLLVARLLILNCCSHWSTL